MLYKYFLSAFFLSFILTPLIRYFAGKYNLVAKPAKNRWHKRTTALYGGVAIYIGLSLPLLLFLCESKVNFFDFISLHRNLFHFCLFDPFSKQYPVIFLWLCITWFFLLGLWDDLRNLSPHSKLIGQIIGAAVFVFAGFRLGWFSSYTLDTLITMMWIVGIVNAFNLIDNMDGLCAGTGLIALSFFILLFKAKGVNVEYFQAGTAIPVCLAGALAGFLIYNFNPASIFMGDCGSMVIGFVLAATGINYNEMSSGGILSAVMVPVIILCVPIVDTMIVTSVRLLSGRKASVGGKDHTSHRLVAMGFSEREAVLILYGVSIFAGATAFFMIKNDSFTAPAIVVPFMLAVLFMGIYISQIRIYREKEFSVLREKKIPRILTALALKWQLLFVILDFFLISFSYYIAYRLRFENARFVLFFRIFLSSLPVVIICKFIAFVYFDIYKTLWHQTDFSDFLDYFKAAFAGTILSIASVAYLFRFKSFSKGVFIIDFLFTIALLMITRGSFRFFTYIGNKKQLGGEKIIIYGAGRCGEFLIREIMANPDLEFNPIGFIDKNHHKKGKKICGFKILGNADDLQKMADFYQISGIVISVNHIDAEESQKLVDLCRQKDLFLKRFNLSVSDF